MAKEQPLIVGASAVKVSDRRHVGVITKIVGHRVETRELDGTVGLYVIGEIRLLV